jgi:exodeoxyribonuclease VII large subunit
MDDGVRIRIMGPLDLWVPGGRLQLQMQGIDPTYTLGLLASERDRVLRSLATDGLLGRNKELALPTVPRRIGLVTAAGSAAEADFLQTLADSPLTWEVVVVDARVQGAGSERSVAAALLAATGAGVDLVALVRGGGARTDLATFDQEVVARTIATLGVPVLTGIGHEIDTSVADAVAHSAHKTPTACAAAIVDLALTAAARVEVAWHGIAILAERRMTDEAARVAGHATHAARGVRSRLAVEDHRADVASLRLRRTAPAAIDRGAGAVERRAGRAEGAARAHLRLHAHTLDALTARIAPGGTAALRRAGAELAGAGAHLSALDPARALARGWSITRTTTGSVVRRSTDVGPGDTLVTTLADGTVTSTVTPVPTGEDPPDAV